MSRPAASRARAGAGGQQQPQQQQPKPDQQAAAASSRLAAALQSGRVRTMRQLTSISRAPLLVCLHSTWNTPCAQSACVWCE